MKDAAALSKQQHKFERNLGEISEQFVEKCEKFAHSPLMLPLPSVNKSLNKRTQIERTADATGGWWGLVGAGRTWLIITTTTWRSEITRPLLLPRPDHCGVYLINLSSPHRNTVVP